MLFILKVIAALILLAVVVIGIYILLQGKEEMFFEVTQRTKARLIKRSENKLEFEVELPMHNDGKEEGIILDAFIRVYLPQEQYADAQLRGRVNLKEAPREDDYFEAMLLGPGAGTWRYFEAGCRRHAGCGHCAVSGLPWTNCALYCQKNYYFA